MPETRAEKSVSGGSGRGLAGLVATEGGTAAPARASAGAPVSGGIHGSACVPGAIRTPLVDSAIRASRDGARSEHEMSIQHPRACIGEPHEAAAAAAGA